MLDEQQGGGDWQISLLTYNMTVEEGLQVVVTMILHVGRIKDCCNIRQILLFLGSCLIINDAYDIFACLWVGDAV